MDVFNAVTQTTLCADANTHQVSDSSGNDGRGENDGDSDGDGNNIFNNNNFNSNNNNIHFDNNGGLGSPLDDLVVDARFVAGKARRGADHYGSSGEAGTQGKTKALGEEG